MKKLVIFSKTIPDYTMGGNGNILFHLLKNLNKDFKEVEIVLLKYDNDKINNSFKKNFPKIKFKIKSYYVGNLKKNFNFKFNINPIRRSFESILDLYFYKIIVSQNLDLIKNSNKIISFGFEWALSIPKINNDHYCILNDPPQLIYYEKNKGKSNILDKLKLKLRVFFFEVYQRIILKRLNQFIRFGTFPYQHYLEYKKFIKDIKLLPYFTKKNFFIKKNINTKKLNFIHIGSLETSASKLMMNKFFLNINQFERYKIPINLFIIGKVKKKQTIKYSNRIKIHFLGHGNEKKINRVIKKMDFGFCPMNYGIGIRTRILTLMSYGIPVIVDNLSLLGFENKIINNDFFLNLEERDNFHKNFKYIISDNVKYKKLRKNSYDAWSRNFEPVKNNKILSKVIFK